MASQFFAQDFRQVISFLQTRQILDGKKLLFPLNKVDILVLKEHLACLVDGSHARQSTLDLHH